MCVADKETAVVHSQQNFMSSTPILEKVLRHKTAHDPSDAQSLTSTDPSPEQVSVSEFTASAKEQPSADPEGAGCVIARAIMLMLTLQ